MSSLTTRLLNTLSKGGQFPFPTIQQQFPPQEIEEECIPLIKNGSITLKDGILFMTKKQIDNFALLFDVR